jgi:CHAT domain-containing protein/Tfp pilus assembly protein PilF
MFRSLFTSWCLCLFVGATCGLMLVPRLMPLHAADPQPPLTPEQREKLKERDRLVEEANRLLSEGKLAEAIAVAEKVLAIERQLFGDRAAAVVASLQWLAHVHEQRQDFTAAGKRLREVRDIQTARYGQDDWRVTDARLALADLELRAKLDGEQRKQLAEAERLHRQSVALYEKGRSREAVPLAERALALRKQVLGDKHPAYATSLNNLAALYWAMGDYAKAEPLCRQASAICKQALGDKHPDYATSLNNLAALYDSMGDHAQAEPLYRQALAIDKEALGEKHPRYATDLNNLAGLYRVMGDHAQAEPLYRQALDIRKQVLGDKHPDYATSLNNLAELYQEMGDYAKAEPLYRQALAIDKEALGEKHPGYATDLNNLAALYDSMGDHAKAEPLCRQASAIYKQALGDKHPHYAASLNSLAALYRAMGDYAKAEPLCQKALVISRDNLELAAAAQSERQQLAMLEDERFHLDAYLSLAAEAKQPAERLYEQSLSWKGAVSLRQRNQRLARRHPELADDSTELDRVAARLATLAFSLPDPRHLDEHRRQIQELTEDKERLESRLARRSADFRQEKERQRLTPAQLQVVLPADAALLDFLEYTQYRPSAEKKGQWHYEDRLMAFVVRRDSLVRVDLGPVQPIQEALKGWQLVLQRRFRTKGDDALGAAVRKLIWQPLEKHLQGAKLVLVSPDGTLARVPFAALPGSKKDTYLLEELAIAVVPVPQLLPQLLAPRSDENKTEPSLLLVGNVSYDAASGGAAVVDSRSAPRAGTLLSWKPLESTRAEVAAVKDSFQRRFRRGLVTDLREDEASEAEVRKEAPRHRYLHLATHGFFAPTELRSALSAASRGKEGDAGNLFGRKDVAGFHPGLLSGLVLAGANRPAAPDKDDGILTALEVESLDLTGVELATLSACETGLGETAGGEGLLGLQRAFQVAGARSVVASLWQVDDEATRQLMVRCYENLWRTKDPAGKLTALREAQLWMLREGIKRGLVRRTEGEEDAGRTRTPPYYWAAFVLSGDWR